MKRAKQNRQNTGEGGSPVNPKIVLVTGWWSENRRSSVTVALKLTSILTPLSNQLAWVVTNQDIEGALIGDTTLIRIRSKHVEGALPIVSFYYLLHQVKVIIAMLKLVILSKVDVFIFAFGSDTLILPILIGRLSGKKIIIRSDGRPSYSTAIYYSKLRKNYSKLSKIKVVLYHMIEAITYSSANILATEGKGQARYKLQKYSNKATVGKLYVDTHLFSNTKKLTERTYEVGYIGRLHKDKGILELVQSLTPLINDRHFHVIIVGDGELRNNIETILARDNIQGKVALLRWVENKELPRYLNDIKVLVLPSYREGVPNIVLESMACGTPVLATPVGGIPDLIRDGETGFIMEDNSPECIARNLIRALTHPDLEQIAVNARNFMEKEYSYEVVVDSYRNMLTSLIHK